MKIIGYSYKNKKRASTLLALGISEFEATETLLKNAHYRESLVHMYFVCFYLSQAFLLNELRGRVSHRAVEKHLHSKYGKSNEFPRRYVDLHSFLHNLRTTFNYKYTHVPSPLMLKQKNRFLAAYVKFALKHVPRVDIMEILQGLITDCGKKIRDLSFDVYCPRTYSHHVRITFWHPPSYLSIFSVKQLITYAQRMLRSLRVRKWQDYVVGLNSRLDQYGNAHIMLLDIDTLDSSVEAELKSIGGILMKSGRGLHFISDEIIESQKKWEIMMRRIKRSKELGPYIDKNFIEMSIKRGYATLRLTESPVKPVAPIFYKEL